MLAWFYIDCIYCFDTEYTPKRIDGFVNRMVALKLRMSINDPPANYNVYWLFLEHDTPTSAVAKWNFVNSEVFNFKLVI